MTLVNSFKSLLETDLESYLDTLSFWIDAGTGTASEIASDTGLSNPAEVTRRKADTVDGGSTTLDTTNNQLELVFWVPSTSWNNLLSTAYNESVTTAADGSIGGVNFVAQKFSVPYDCNVTQLKLMLKKVGTPVAGLTVEIQEDNAGVPSGTAITNGSTTIAEADVGTAYAWVTASFSTDPSLTGGSYYWIVLSEASGSAGDYYLEYDDGNSLGLSGVGLSTDSGSSWTIDSTDTGLVKVYINKFKEIGVFDASTGGNLIARNVFSSALTKDDITEYQFTVKIGYDVVLNTG